MSATVETSNVSWRKRRRQGDQSSGLQIEIKKPRYYYRLASESSIGSEEDTESVYSVQNRETDVVRDTSDTDSKADDEFEYEVASLSESESGMLGSSTSDSDDQIIFAATIEAICDSSLETTWITDGEESDNSSLDDSSITRLGFTSCVQCKSVNDNPLYRYCEKCFQDRKKFYPPRPRGNKKTKKKVDDPPVKLDTLRSCLSGLSSQDSGIGSSQECPLLGLDQIVVPNSHLKAGTSITDERDILQKDNMSKEHDRDLRRKRQASESSLSDFEIKKPKYAHIVNRDGTSSRRSRPYSRNSTKNKNCVVPENDPSPLQEQFLLSEPDNKSLSLTQSSTEKSISLSQASTTTCLSQSSKETSSSTEKSLSSQPSISKDFSQTSDYGSEVSAKFTRTLPEESLSLSLSQSSTNFLGSDSSQTSELCIMCNSAPKNSIFLHTNIGHQCCCYKCAKRTLYTTKRCPICNRSVNKVVKIYKA